MFKNMIAILLILVGVFGNKVSGHIANIINKPLPSPPPIPAPYVPDEPTPLPPNPPTVDIEKPNSEILLKGEPVSAVVTDREDRIKLAIFNLEFSKRILAFSPSK